MIPRSIGFLLVFLFTLNAFANPNNRGYSGAPGSLGRCSSSCHGVNQGTVQISGFPTEYVPDSTYLLTIEAISGLPIKNFNGSVRLGTGSVTAGVITAGFNTATYTVAQENNGVRLSILDRQSANFSWTAPAEGTGTVRLYVAAHQGARDTGPNTNITLVSNEAVIPQAPDAPSNLTPVSGATNVPLNTLLTWSPVANADFYSVHFGNSSPPPVVDDVVTQTTYPLIGLLPGTEYFWQIYTVNDIGSTPGPVWSFTTLALPGQATNPVPINGAVDVPLQISLSWAAAPNAVSYEIFLGSSEPLGTIGTTNGLTFSSSTALSPNTTYLWRVDATNNAGTTASETWSFTTEAESGVDDRFVVSEFALGQAYPNPFNNNVRVSLSLAQAGLTRVKVFDIRGREIATLANSTLDAGEHILEWNAAGSAAGVYLLRCESAGVTQSRKLVYLP